MSKYTKFFFVLIFTLNFCLIKVHGQDSIKIAERDSIENLNFLNDSNYNFTEALVGRWIPLDPNYASNKTYSFFKPKDTQNVSMRKRFEFYENHNAKLLWGGHHKEDSRITNYYWSFDNLKKVIKLKIKYSNEWFEIFYLGKDYFEVNMYPKSNNN